MCPMHVVYLMKPLNEFCFTATMQCLSKTTELDSTDKLHDHNQNINGALMLNGPTLVIN